VFYDIPGEDRSKKAYAFYGQSTVGDLLTKLLVRVCEQFGTASELEVQSPRNIRACGYNVLLNIHDAIAVSVPNDKIVINEVIRVITKESAIPMEIGGNTLVIPMDFHVGPSWGEVKDYKI
jgi:hypothetical protein